MTHFGPHQQVSSPDCTQDDSSHPLLRFRDPCGGLPHTRHWSPDRRRRTGRERRSPALRGAQAGVTTRRQIVVGSTSSWLARQASMSRSLAGEPRGPSAAVGRNSRASSIAAGSVAMGGAAVAARGATEVALAPRLLIAAFQAEVVAACPGAPAAVLPPSATAPPGRRRPRRTWVRRGRLAQPERYGAGVTCTVA